jgi:hypothetical protein
VSDDQGGGERAQKKTSVWEFADRQRGDSDAPDLVAVRDGHTASGEPIRVGVTRCRSGSKFAAENADVFAPINSTRGRDAVRSAGGDVGGAKNADGSHADWQL